MCCYSIWNKRAEIDRRQPEEQAETIVKLEAEEAKGKALMEELRPTLNEVFAHLPEHDRGRVGESPERMRRALNIYLRNV
jgi:hypothetical protein